MAKLNSTDIYGSLLVQGTTNTGTLTTTGTFVAPLGTTSLPSYTFSGDLNTGLFSPAADTLALVEGGVEVVRITSSGNVGIGTNNPGNKLDISSSTAGGATLRIRDSAANGYPTINLTNDARTWTIYNNGSLSDIFDIYDATAAQHRFVIDSSGNIGIGTTSPGQKLHVVGDARIEGNLTVNGSVTQVNTNVANTEQLSITNDGTGPAVIVNQTGAQPVVNFQDDGVSAFYIEDGGNVGIGTTDPGTKLSVVTASNDDGIQIRRSSGTTNDYASLNFVVTTTAGNNFQQSSIRSIRTNTNFSGDSDLAFLTANIGGSLSEHLRIKGDGSVGIGETNPLDKLHIKDGGIIVEQGNILIASSSNAEGGEDGGGTGKPTLWFSEAEGTAVESYSMGIEYDGDDLSSGSNRISIVNGSSVELMSVQLDGKVGINTTSPGEFLDVNGSIKIRETGVGNGLLLHTNSGISITNNLMQVWSSQTSGISFHTNGVGDGSLERMRITSTGLIGIGTSTPSAKLDVVGDIKHTGLTMTDGTNVDQLKTTTFTSALTTSWTDVTGVSGTYLATGSYIVQIESNGEYYTGNMAWFSGTTTSTTADEIVLHRAGPAASAGRIYARVIRTSSAPSTLKLQVSGSDSISSHTMTFKFRRTI
jgi:hypothetical protein